MINKKEVLDDNYKELLNDIKQKIILAQYSALKAINRELINLYWEIGKTIVENQEKAGWGKSVVEQLTKDLQIDFPGMRGFSSRNLWYMRNFYNDYNSNTKLQAVIAEISWTHHLLILEKCKDPLEREFYIKMARKYKWSSRVLSNHIENQAYERTLLGQNNFDKNLPAPLNEQSKFLVRDEYTLPFLGLDEEHSERELEIAIISKIEPFLKEMGGLFSFIGSQYNLEVDGKEYFIDLLLFHRQLKCLVVIELKIGEFIPEYVGKMQFYLSALDAEVKLKGENPSIGIILCKSKKKTTVEYALKDSNKPIGVATYSIVKKLPKELKDQLPTSEQIAKLLEDL